MATPIYYGQHLIDPDDIEAVQTVLTTGALTCGPQIPRFEEEFAHQVRAPYAVAVSNGTAALHLAVLALGLKPGQMVIVSSMSFAASANCVLYAGGQVVFADVNPDTGLIDLQSVAEKIELHQKDLVGIIAVDLCGRPADWEQLAQVARSHNLWLLQDACHSPGATYEDSQGKDYYVGSAQHADCCCFSFHPVKHIACGEGGMITTQREDLAKKMALLRTHGITKNAEDFQNENEGPWYSEMQMLGYNYRLSDLLAALGRSQLKKLDERIDERLDLAKRYAEELKNTSLVLPEIEGNFRHALHLYAVQTEQRDLLFKALQEDEIYCQVHYVPIYTHPYYQSLGHKRGQCPGAEKYYERTLSLPLYPGLRKEAQDRVVSKIKEVLLSS